MSLPPRAFYSLTETCARWGCAAADLAAWAATDQLTLMTSIAAAICGKQPVAGIVAVSAADMMAMFRRHGASDEECRVFRIRPQGSAEWQYITEPAAGVLVKITDILLLAEEVHRFEEERDLLRRPLTSNGSAPRYDWEGVGDINAPQIASLLLTAEKKILASGKPMGTVPFQRTWQDLFDLGYAMVNSTSDIGMTRDRSLADVAKFRELFAESVSA